MKQNKIIYIAFKRSMDVFIGLFGTVFIVLPCSLVIFVIYKMKVTKEVYFLHSAEQVSEGKNLKSLSLGRWSRMQKKF